MDRRPAQALAAATALVFKKDLRECFMISPSGVALYRLCAAQI